MTNEVGPAFVGGFEEFVANDESGEQYTVLFLPDRNNDQLQREGKAPVFYYVPEQVRLARKGDTGDYKFRHTHFVGVFDENTNVGLDGGEVQGGVLAFTTTSRYPTSVLQQAQSQLVEKWQGETRPYWGIRTSTPPMIRVAPIVNNITAVTNLSPDAGGSVPGGDGGGAAPATGGGGGGAPPPGGGAPRSRDIVQPRLARSPRTVPHGRAFRAPSNLDAWAWRLQGQGPGSITGGENAYSGLIGAIPSEIIWAGFHGAYSPIVVAQNLQLQMWSQLMRIKITGNWNRIFSHFSGAASGRYLWFGADIQAEFNNLRINGDIEVEVDIDGTTPGAAEMEKAIQQRIDTVVQQFTEQAKKVIFDPPQPSVQPAQAPSGGIFSSIFGYGGGLALKARVDATNLNLNYEETRYFRYLQPHTISSSLEGFFDEIKNDPAAEQKYFTRLVLGGLGRKVHRIVKPVVNWPDPVKQWVGEPVAFLSAQVGYPDQDGNTQWQAELFQKTDALDRTWEPVFVQWRDDEVSNPPADWDPDETYIKRKVHLMEPPGESEYPNMRVFVEQNVIELDDGPNGTLNNDNVLEVRADRTGVLDVGPISLNAELETSRQVVEVEFRALGTRADGSDRSQNSTRFRWSFLDQNEPRYWRIFTGQSDFVPRYEYRVHVTVKGTLFSKGMAWSGPWEPGSGNGPLMVQVPAPDAPGVQSRSLTSREIVSAAVVRVDGTSPEAPVSGDGGVGPPRTGNGSGGVGAPRTGRETPEVADRMERTVHGYEVRSEESRTSPEAPSSSRTKREKSATTGYSRSEEREGPSKTMKEAPEGWVEVPEATDSY